MVQLQCVHCAHWNSIEVAFYTEMLHHIFKHKLDGVTNAKMASSWLPFPGFVIFSFIGLPFPLFPSQYFYGSKKSTHKFCLVCYGGLIISTIPYFQYSIFFKV